MRRALPLLAVLFLGCRSVWVHPEATAEKYADDLFFCQRGMERAAWLESQQPPVAESDRAWALAGTAGPGTVKRGWKRCMVNLGWDTRAGARSDPAWKRPDPPKRRHPGGPK